jgi:HEAT repeat protein
MDEIKRLIDQFHADKPKDRWPAVHALGKLGTAAIEPLLAALQGSDQEAKPWPLLAILQGDADFDSQQFAIAELGEIGDLRAVEPLMAAPVHPNVWRRWGATVALGKIADPRALPDLERVAREDKSKTEFGSLARLARQAVEKIRQRTNTYSA